MSKRFSIPLGGYGVPLIRSDFTDEGKWLVTLDVARAPYSAGPADSDTFSASFQVLDDPQYDGITVTDVVDSLPCTSGDSVDERIDSIDDLPAGSYPGVILADRRTLDSQDHLFVVVDLYENPGHSVRVPANKLWIATSSMETASQLFEEWSDRFEQETAPRM